MCWSGFVILGKREPLVGGPRVNVSAQFLRARDFMRIPSSYTVKLELMGKRHRSIQDFLFWAAGTGTGPPSPTSPRLPHTSAGGRTCTSCHVYYAVPAIPEPPI